MGLAEEYQERYDAILQPVAVNLELLIADHLKGLMRIDRVSARAKSPDRFLEKAAKLDADNSPRYGKPLEDVQDQVGARIVVFYEDDVQPVADEVRKYFPSIETEMKVPEDNWTFGYFGLHFLLALPGDVIPAGIPIEDAPPFFELQVRTLFQHAWSEADHDLGYKSPVDLSDDQQRRLAFTAAQAWGADRVFSELLRELSA